MFPVFVFSGGLELSNARVQWTLACRRLDDGNTIIFSFRGKCKRVPFGVPGTGSTIWCFLFLFFLWEFCLLFFLTNFLKKLKKVLAFFESMCYYIRVVIRHAPIAQLDRVTDYESVGRGFESLSAYQEQETLFGVSCFCFFRGTRTVKCQSPVDDCNTKQMEYPPVIDISS